MTMQVRTALVSPEVVELDEVEGPASTAATVLARIAADDADGARDELRRWCEALNWRKQGSTDLQDLAVLLVDKVVELWPETIGDVDRPDGGRCFDERRDDYTFVTSTHLSLLTAAVVRQRSQIADLLGLVDRLSRRLS